ncbi:MAG: 3-phosphoglycerate dehydrogenase [Gemmatimonadetes bacterium]|jgi:D-3-phosphoglycerate dehydrogenase|nr:3-phosphoglycerate dehydrogenase [Gemmatimonadota bacterium]HCK12378.1 3-phosphoglycerate dehydrogenase [Candidatus Latescibacterota bacterium]
MAEVKIVVPGDDPPQIQDSPHLDRIAGLADLVIHTDRPVDVDDKVARVKGAEIIMNTRGAVTWGEEEFARLPDLKMITSCSIGTDMFDLESAKAREVIICNQPGRTAPVVAEHMFGLMFAVAKRSAFLTVEMRKGGWPRKDNLVLQGKTLGILGTGAIGAEMARLGNAIGMEVVAWTYNPSEQRARELGVTFKSLDEVLTESDVVSVHVKLTEDSTHLIGADEFSKMKAGSIFLNGARGAVADTAALVEALDSGHLMGAGVDVFEEEPTPADHPLFTCDQAIVTPHCADMTPEGVDLLNGGAVDNVIAYLEGNPQNRVT